MASAETNAQRRHLARRGSRSLRWFSSSIQPPSSHAVRLSANLHKDLLITGTTDES
jgi:hypothetical protein